MRTVFEYEVSGSHTCIGEDSNHLKFDVVSSAICRIIHFTMLAACAGKLAGCLAWCFCACSFVFLLRK